MFLVIINNEIEDKLDEHNYNDAHDDVEEEDDLSIIYHSC